MVVRVLHPPFNNGTSMLDEYFICSEYTPSDPRALVTSSFLIACVTSSAETSRSLYELSITFIFTYVEMNDRLTFWATFTEMTLLFLGKIWLFNIFFYFAAVYYVGYLKSARGTPQLVLPCYGDKL